MTAVNLQHVRRAFQGCRSVLDLCDEIDELRAANAVLATELAATRAERDAAREAALSLALAS